MYFDCFRVFRPTAPIPDISLRIAVTIYSDGGIEAGLGSKRQNQLVSAGRIVRAADHLLQRREKSEAMVDRLPNLLWEMRRELKKQALRRLLQPFAPKFSV